MSRALSTFAVHDGAPRRLQAPSPLADFLMSVLRIAGGVILGLFLIGLFVLCLAITAAPAAAAERVAPVRIPEVATLYRLKIEREAARNFGLDAPTARLAAQIHQESGWRVTAASAYANGLAQFTPATAAWLPSVCPTVGPPDAWDADWSLRAQACYMHWLHDRIVAYRYARPMSECSRWNLALRGYNGGLGWLNKERLATQRAGGDANDWRDIEQHRVRAGWAHHENIDYPRRILLRIEPAYSIAGWPGNPAC